MNLKPKLQEKRFGHSFLHYLLLPIILTIYVISFHYANNILLVNFKSFGKLLLLFIGITILIYAIYWIFDRRKSLIAAIGSSIFLVFFYLYGALFTFLRTWDYFQVNHYILLPVMVLVAVLCSFFIVNIPKKTAKFIWKIACIVFSLLFVVNSVKILPVELDKTKAKNENMELNSPANDNLTDQKDTIISTDASSSTAKNPANSVIGNSYPDIYYLVFGEMVGFDAIREYWGYDKINEFENFLKSEKFYIAENSYSQTISTFHELAVRLNYQNYPYDSTDPHRYWDEDFQKIADNKVMSYLKSYGYKIVVYDESIPSTGKYKDADMVYATQLYDLTDSHTVFDDFGLLVINTTMLTPLTLLFEATTTDYSPHEAMIRFTSENIANNAIGSPRLVYVHLLIPHLPFLYDEFGNPIAAKYYSSWDKYFGYYIYTTQYATKMIEKIISESDPANMPVIIFQSDHGARNFKMKTSDKTLKDFPESFQRLIINTLYLPNCQDAPLSQDMNPMNTFPIVFNCYFENKIPLQ